MAEWYTRQSKANLAAHIVKQEADLAAARAEIERLTAERNETAMLLSLHMKRAEKAEAERDEARAQVAARDDIIGSWLSAALEDPNAGPEFKADVQRWLETGHHEALEAYGREKVREGMQRAVELYPQGIAAILAAMEKEGGE